MPRPAFDLRSLQRTGTSASSKRERRRTRGRNVHGGMQASDTATREFSRAPDRQGDGDERGFRGSGKSGKPANSRADPGEGLTEMRAGNAGGRLSERTRRVAGRCRTVERRSLRSGAYELATSNTLAGDRKMRGAPPSHLLFFPCPFYLFSFPLCSSPASFFAFL